MAVLQGFLTEEVVLEFFTNFMELFSDLSINVLSVTDRPSYSLLVPLSVLLPGASTVIVAFSGAVSLLRNPAQFFSLH